MRKLFRPGDEPIPVMKPTDHRISAQYQPFLYDMHLHILPGIDDGAKDMEEARKMLAMEYRQGVRFLCATPHFNLKDPLPADFVREAWSRLSETAARDFPDMEIYLGEELFYSPGLEAALERKEALTINGSRYILVEFHPAEAFAAIYQGLQSLVRAGYIPIVAHVERLGCLWRNTSAMNQLKEMYVLFQMNTGSLAGGFSLSGRQCRRLVKEGYIDLLGTDAHSSTWRSPDYGAGASWIHGHCSQEMLKRLCIWNPRAVLQDQLLQI